MLSKDNFQPTFDARRFRTLPGGVLKRYSGRRGGRHSEDRNDTTAGLVKAGLRLRRDPEDADSLLEGE